MAELLEKVDQLRKIDSSVHWFCERKDGHGSASSGSPSEEPSVEKRIALVMDAIIVFSFDGPQAEEPKRFMKDGITRNLLRCDQCIADYYRAKQGMLEGLRNEGFEDEQVDTFADWLDDHAIERISRGLKRAVEILRDIPGSERRPGSLSRSTLMSLYEGLYCEKFMKDDEKMTTLFDEPFRLCQEQERLSPKSVSPAMIRFAFGKNDYLHDWAMKEWELRPFIEARKDFAFALRPGLSEILPRAGAVPVTDIPFLTRFWTVMAVIIDGLEPSLITHELRTLSVDPCRLTIEHLNIDTSTFIPLLQTITALLKKSPTDYWDAMGTISPHSIIDGVFHNAMYDRTVTASSSGSDESYNDFQALVGWVRPFMESVQSSNQAQSCRQLANQFLQRLQGPQFPDRARSRCRGVGLNVLKWVIIIRLNTGTHSDAVSRAIATQLLGIVTGYLDNIVSTVERETTSDSSSAEIRDLSQDVVQAALTLECRLLRIDHETLAKENHLSEGSKTLNLEVWKKIVPRISSRSVRMARAALPATVEISDLGQFGPKGPADLSGERESFNGQFKECVELMAKVFERISDMQSKELKVFVHDSKVRPALVAALLSSEETLYEAAMDVAKNVSGEATREDALRFMLEPRLADTLNDFSEALKKISVSKNFYPCPRMLRTSSDILGILCDPQDGLLRRSSMGDAAKDAVSEYWQRQWQALTTIYKMTEEWSAEQPQSIMKEFCRDTMQFSAKLFDEYSVFENASSTEGDKGEETKESQRRLLADPSSTMDSMVVWLRLRDEYLAATAVSIITKLIGQLQQAQMVVSNKVIKTLTGIIQGTIRNKLHGQQKAELAKAIDWQDEESVSDEMNPTKVSRNGTQGLPSRDSPSYVTKSKTTQRLKVGTMDSWLSKGRSGETLGKEMVDLTNDDVPAIDKMIKGKSSSNEQYKKQQEAARAAAVQKKADEKERQAKAAQDSFLEKRQKERIERKKKDAAAAAKMRAQNPNSLAGQTAGQGSALSGIGNMGKDHSAKKGSGMLLSSDEDSDDDDDSGTLFRSKKAPTASAGFRDLDAQRRQKMSQQGPVKKTRQVRSAKDMRARLVPNLAPLHRDILNWDLFQGGDFPPGTARADYRLVTSSFRTAMEYRQTFRPLLLLEAWQGFQQTLEEGLGKSFQLQIASRLSIDSLVEISTSMELSEFQNIGLSESDIVILASEKNIQSTSHRCSARLHKIGRRRATNIELTFRVSSENSAPLNKMSSAGDAFGCKIGSLTPLEREYSALSGLEYYDLCQEIIEAMPSPLLPYNDEKLSKICRMYSLNKAQAKAVQSAVDNDAFTLIQGPPGSGKTKTIVSIVGALLTETMRRSGGTAIHMPKTTNGQQDSSGAASKKLLVCAPSNAAVDELVMRLMGGVKTYAGETHNIKVIRLGRSDRINPKVAGVTLDELVNQQMNASEEGEKAQKAPSEIEQAKQAHRQTNEEVKALQAKMDDVDAGNAARDPADSAKLEKLKRQRQSLSTRIDQLKDSGNTRARDADIKRRAVQQAVIDSAHVLCATLSGSGHDMFQGLKIDFETVIIDEAAQSVELSALIPLKYGCNKCIMVGDPKQLPPTVLSRAAARFQYEQSLFVRMQDNSPDNVHLLDTQYRMHPEISQFPSTAFYDKRLLDGDSMVQLRTKFWHQDQYLGPYRFFDVKGQHESGPRGHSLINRAEIEVAFSLYQRLRKVAKNYDFVGKIGIITPYKSQLQQLRDRFKREFGEDIFKTIEFNTTDAFQGRESEIIIFSCVRASEGGIGFLSDIRRMNVGITRAKCSLWVLGNTTSLQKGEYWKKMIVDARERKLVTDGDVRDLIRRPAKVLTNTETKPAPAEQPSAQNSAASPISPIEKAPVERSYSPDAMDVDEPEEKKSVSRQPINDGADQTEKRKRGSLDLEDGPTGKSPRVGPSRHVANGADVTKLSSLKEESEAKEEQPDRSEKPKPPMVRRPPRPQGSSVFIQKKPRKR